MSTRLRFQGKKLEEWGMLGVCCRSETFPVIKVKFSRNMFRGGFLVKNGFFHLGCGFGIGRAYLWCENTLSRGSVCEKLEQKWITVCLCVRQTMTSTDMKRLCCILRWFAQMWNLFCSPPAPRLSQTTPGKRLRSFRFHSPQTSSPIKQTAYSSAKFRCRQNFM